MKDCVGGMDNRSDSMRIRIHAEKNTHIIPKYRESREERENADRGSIDRVEEPNVV